MWLEGVPCRIGLCQRCRRAHFCSVPARHRDTFPWKQIKHNQRGGASRVDPRVNFFVLCAQPLLGPGAAELEEAWGGCTSPMSLWRWAGMGLASFFCPGCLLSSPPSPAFSMPLLPLLPFPHFAWYLFPPPRDFPCPPSPSLLHPVEMHPGPASAAAPLGTPRRDGMWAVRRAKGRRGPRTSQPVRQGTFAPRGDERRQNWK